MRSRASHRVCVVYNVAHLAKLCPSSPSRLLSANRIVEQSERHDVALLERSLVNDQHHVLDQSFQEQNGYKPAPAKVMLGDTAKQELDKMKLHGKARKQTIKWHKKQVKEHMQHNPHLNREHHKASTATIEWVNNLDPMFYSLILQRHLVHKGGSNPKEKNHITASFRKENNQHILNTFNGGVRCILLFCCCWAWTHFFLQRHHHLYVNNGGLNRHGKAAWEKNNANITGQSHSHQTSVGKTRSSGKSSNKGKGKQNPQQNFSKNSNKDFQQKRRKWHKIAWQCRNPCDM